MEVCIVGPLKLEKGARISLIHLRFSIRRIKNEATVLGVKSNRWALIVFFDCYSNDCQEACFFLTYEENHSKLWGHHSQKMQFWACSKSTRICRVILIFTFPTTNQQTSNLNLQHFSKSRVGISIIIISIAHL